MNTNEKYNAMMHCISICYKYVHYKSKFRKNGEDAFIVHRQDKGKHV